MDAYATLPLNSLLAPKNSLLGLLRFPVPLRREFRWELLYSLANLHAKIAAERLNLQNSLLNSLLTGSLVRRLVRTRLHRQPRSVVSGRLRESIAGRSGGGQSQNSAGFPRRVPATGPAATL